MDAAFEAGSGVFVGNDVVDLEVKGSRGKAADTRFVRRVLDSTEYAALEQASEPDLELWTFWACKEAAFKVVSKLLGGPPVFRHAAFGSRLGPRHDPGDGMLMRSGVVEYEGRSLRVVTMAHANVVHAFSVARRRPDPDPVSELRLGLELLAAPDRPWAGEYGELLERLTEREAEPVHGLASAAVRLGARHALAQTLGIAESRLEIVCDPGPAARRPPRVLLDGARCACDVSLSHHGRWIAWALHAPPIVRELG